MNTITVKTIIKSSIDNVWEKFTTPSDIEKWNFASDDWECPKAKNDLQIGGEFKFVMAAKDGSTQFDFAGTYSDVKENELIEYDIADSRHVKIDFKEVPDGVEVIEEFEMESENSEELQREGWQSILDNFSHYVETN